MKAVFVDTSYWIALLYTHDHLHAKVAAISQRLSAVKLVTSEMVLTELLNGLSNGSPRMRSLAVREVEGIRMSESVIVFPQTTEQFTQALERYKQSADKSWSLTDCASFHIMETERISAALTHDHHFVQAGFEALLR
ncbi:MAG: type II toxin-antitoxin system VapC family toxin [Candidatus Acidiferrales bacterium]